MQRTGALYQRLSPLPGVDPARRISRRAAHLPRADWFEVNAMPFSAGVSALMQELSSVGASARVQARLRAQAGSVAQRIVGHVV